MACDDQIVGRAVPRVTDWQHLNLDYVVKAHIDQTRCIQCSRCHIACEDTSHQAISHLSLCAVVCPVEGCITLQPLTEGIDPRTGVKVGGHRTWLEHPNNPAMEPAMRALASVD